MNINGVSIFITLVVIGILRLVYIIVKISLQKSFTGKYLKQFNHWLGTPITNNSNNELYSWLMQNTGRIQLELGRDGVAANYIPPFSNYASTNYQIIVNTLPLIKIGIANSLEVNTCQDVLNRHIGNLNHIRKEYFLRLLNPFQWIIIGIKTIITFPIYLFYWLGLYKYSKIVNIEGSKNFKIISLIGTLISFTGLIIGLVVDWDDFWRIIIQK